MTRISPRRSCSGVMPRVVTGEPPVGGGKPCGAPPGAEQAATRAQSSGTTALSRGRAAEKRMGCGYCFGQESQDMPEGCGWKGSD